MVNYKRKIAIIGASYLQDPLIKKARTMGLETHVFAWAAADVGEKSADFFYPISIKEKERILDKCREIGINGICSIASDLAVITVNYVAYHMGLIGNSLDNSVKATNKAVMRREFALRGDPSPRNICIHEDDSLSNLDLDYPLIVKPIDRSGSRGVSEINDVFALKEAVELARKNGFENEILIEEFVKGKEYSVECISYEGEHRLLAVTEKYTTGAPHFIETGHMQPADICDEMLIKVERVVFHALDTLEISYGASHSEIKIDGEDIKIIEIGARMGGDLIGSSLVSVSTGIDFVKAVIQISMGERPDLMSCGNKAACGIRFVLSKEDIEVYQRLRREHSEYIIGADVPREVKEPVRDSSSRQGYYLFKADVRGKLIPYMPQQV